MPSVKNKQSRIKITPKDGEIEITLNINLNLSGDSADVVSQDEEVVAIQSNVESETEEDASPLIPDFNSNGKLSGFGFWK